jgi:hypothetical protein
MSHPILPEVIIHGKAQINTMEGVGKVIQISSDHKMKMVSHYAIG